MATDRDAVLTAAVTVLSRKSSASLEEIARAAGISRATLHRLFAGREALVQEAAAASMQRIQDALDSAAIAEGDPVEAVRRMAAAVVPHAEAAAFVTGENRLFDISSFTDAWTRMDELVTALFLRGQQSGAFKVELPAAWLSEAFFDLLAGVGWSLQEGRIAPRDSTLVLTELFLGGALRGGSPT